MAGNMKQLAKVTVREHRTEPVAHSSRLHRDEWVFTAPRRVPGNISKRYGTHAYQNTACHLERRSSAIAEDRSRKICGCILSTEYRNFAPRPNRPGPRPKVLALPGALFIAAPSRGVGFHEPLHGAALQIIPASRRTMNVTGRPEPTSASFLGRT